MTDGETPIRDAATVILLKRQRSGLSVLMGMRGAKAAFMPSKYVFPGGAVDKTDSGVALARPLDEVDRSRLQREPRDGVPIDADAIAVAALRELAEETGLLIGQTGADCDLPGFRETGLAPDAQPLNYMFRAITPPGRPRRFDARFFVSDAADLYGDPDDFSAACDELSHLHWVPLTEARGLDLPFITEVVLAELTELAAEAGDGPLVRRHTVPFFDNRTSRSRFSQIS